MSRFFGACRVLMSAAKSGAGTAAAATASTAPKSGLMKPMPVSPALRKFLGVPEISRAQVLKKIWEHIKANNLQDPSNKQQICCDEKLKSIFGGKDRVGMLEIAKLVSPHFVK